MKGGNAITLEIYYTSLHGSAQESITLAFTAPSHITHSATPKIQILFSAAEKTSLSIEQGQQSLSLINNKSYYNHK